MSSDTILVADRIATEDFLETGWASVQEEQVNVPRWLTSLR